ncbi:hypothetical protein GCM10008915_28030 [Bifidobacterium pullorum subsp. gallinarum]
MNKGFNGIILQYMLIKTGWGGDEMTILWGNIIITLVAGFIGVAVVVLGIVGLLHYVKKK